MQKAAPSSARGQHRLRLRPQRSAKGRGTKGGHSSLGPLSALENLLPAPGLQQLDLLNLLSLQGRHLLLLLLLLRFFPSDLLLQSLLLLLLHGLLLERLLLKRLLLHQLLLRRGNGERLWCQHLLGSGNLTKQRKCLWNHRGAREQRWYWRHLRGQRALDRRGRLPERLVVTLGARVRTSCCLHLLHAVLLHLLHAVLHCGHLLLELLHLLTLKSRLVSLLLLRLRLNLLLLVELLLLLWLLLHWRLLELLLRLLLHCRLLELLLLLFKLLLLKQLLWGRWLLELPLLIEWQRRSAHGRQRRHRRRLSHRLEEARARRIRGIRCPLALAAIASRPRLAIQLEQGKWGASGWFWFPPL
jgi:hypothetical protein